MPAFKKWYEVLVSVEMERVFASGWPHSEHIKPTALQNTFCTVVNKLVFSFAGTSLFRFLFGE